MAGRGCLSRWGPNHSINAVITRFARGQGQVLQDNGQPVLQFLSYRTNTDTEKCAFINGMIAPKSLTPHAVKALFTDTNFVNTDGQNNFFSTLKQIDEIFQSGKVLSQVCHLNFNSVHRSCQKNTSTSLAESRCRSTWIELLQC